MPNVKKVEIYDSITFANGTAKTFAKFDVGAVGMRFGYYLALTFEPTVNTLTWTLDYRYNSDFGIYSPLVICLYFAYLVCFR